MRLSRTVASVLTSTGQARTMQGRCKDRPGLFSGAGSGQEWQTTSLGITADGEVDDVHHVDRVLRGDRERLAVEYRRCECAIEADVIAVLRGASRLCSGITIGFAQETGCVLSKVRVAGTQTRLQLIFLHVEAVDDIAAARAMYSEARWGQGRQGAGVQDHFLVGIVQLEMDVVRHLRIVALLLYSRRDGLRRTEQGQRLIDQMRPEVKQQASAMCGFFTPAFRNHRTETIEVRLVMRHASQLAVRNQRAQGHEVTVPAPIMKWRKQ